MRLPENKTRFLLQSALEYCSLRKINYDAISIGYIALTYSCPAYNRVNQIYFNKEIRLGPIGFALFELVGTASINLLRICPPAMAAIKNVLSLSAKSNVSITHAGVVTKSAIVEIENTL